MVVRLNPARKRALLCCSVLGFGSSASFFLLAALMGSPLMGLVGVMLGVLAGVDVWRLLTE